MSLFVYGTLMLGQPAHQLIASRAEFQGRVRTAPRYALLDLGAYPALVEGRDAVAGELYAVEPSLFGVLDDYEGVPELYERVRIELQDERRAQAYLLVDRRLRRRGERIESADWRRRCGRPSWPA